MLLDQRRDQLLKVIEETGFASLQQLAERCGASESTVRRDLEYLDSIGQVRRTRGGAAYIGESLTDFEERRSRNAAQKRRIAAAAVELIEPGEPVLLDGGTTTLEVARCLAGRSQQVVTNSLPIVNLLVNQPQIELVVIGGYLHPKTGVNLGPLAVAALKHIHVRRLVMSAGGVTERGLYNSNTLLVETERQMIESAQEVILVCDSSKLGRPALAHLCELDVADRMVIDDGISDEWRRVIETAGIELTIAK
ncbi:MAG: DeoR/GlpR family DNA-binding transcription regulator [Planctomycetes bacterium]|nr:DeoR/GlpR family DNA-binding transcription regulator [Planctomycetota bacterium]